MEPVTSIPAVLATLGEREMLLAWLAQHRACAIAKVQGIDDEVARLAQTPSGLPLLGLINHLAHVERWWARDIWAGEDCTYDWTDDDPDGEYHLAPGMTVASVVDAYVAESALVEALILAAPDLEGLSQRRIPRTGFDDLQPVSLRFVLSHLVEETARHNGHLDLLREAIDGQVGDPPLRPI